MKETLNYKLKKPEQNDYVNIEDINYNVDILDTKLKETETQLIDNDTNVGAIRNDVGIMSELETKDKTSLVNAVNEVNKQVSEPKYVSTTSYDNIVSMPNGSINGQVSMNVEGETRTNLIPKYTDKKYYSNVADSKIKVLGDYKISILGEVGAYNWVKVDLDAEENVSYSSNIIRQGSAYITFKDDNNIPIGQDVIVPFTNIISPTGTKKITFTLNSISKEGEILFENMILEKSTRIGNFISGTKSTISASRIKSVGKNLFNWKSEILNDDNITYEELDGRKCWVWRAGNNASSMRIMEGEFKENTQYTISGYTYSEIPAALNFIYTDGTKQQTFWGGDKFSFRQYTSEPNKTIDYINGLWHSGQKIYMDIDSFQIEQGTTATPYEPYKESTAYIITKKDNKVVNLRSLPNGTKDEIRVSGGKAEYIKRVSNEVVLDDNFDNYKPSNYKADYHGRYIEILGTRAGNSANSTCRVWNDDGVELTHVSSCTDNFNCFSDSMGTTILIYIDVEKAGWGSVAPTLQQIKDYFNLHPYTLTYQLAEPEIIPIRWTGLQGYENGTVYFDTIIPELGVYYNNGLQTHYPDHPIASVDTLYKVDKETGLRTSLDVSKCILAENKLSFTHPDLIDGDLVDWDYVPTTESTNGEKTITASTNMSAAVDSLLKDSQTQKENIRQANSRLDNCDNKINNQEDKIDVLNTNLNEYKDDLDIHKTDYIRHIGYGADWGSANVRYLELNPAPTAYKEGMAVAFKSILDNTGAVTINVNELGAKSILKSNGKALSSGNLKSGSIYTIRYNGSNFILQGEGGEYGDAQAQDVLSGKTFGTEEGLVTGLMPNNGSINKIITTENGQIYIPKGYHNGSGYVKAQITNLIAENIKKGVNVGGVVGTYESPPDCIIKTNVYPTSSPELSGYYGVKATGFDFVPRGVIAFSTTDRDYFAIVIDDFTMRNRYSSWRECDTMGNSSFHLGKGVAIIEVPLDTVPYTMIVIK